MNQDQSADFYPDEFKNQNKDIQWLCQTIKNEGDEFGAVNAPENTVEWLNEILNITDFSDKVITWQTSPDLTDEIKRLRDETAGNRGKLFKNLDDNEQKAIRRLNRLTIELAYPRETPKSAYELIALIRTRRGDNFLQDYRNIEAFRKEMKEHRGDLDWGLLVRCDEGRIVADYFAELGDREKIGLVETEPMSTHVTPEGLNPKQAALREAAIKHFKSNKAKAYISEQMTHVNASRQLGDAVRLLFDNNGHPPANAPIEDIIAERVKIEAQIRWLDAISSELRNNLTTLKEIEDSAFELTREDQGKER